MIRGGGGGGGSFWGYVEIYGKVKRGPSPGDALKTEHLDFNNTQKHVSVRDTEYA